MGSEIAARSRKSLATFHRTLKSQCSIAFSCLGNRAISGVRDGHRNRRSQKSLRFRCAKPGTANTNSCQIWPGKTYLKHLVETLDNGIALSEGRGSQ